MDQPRTLGEFFAEAAQGCGYVEREFDPNLIMALDKLGEQFGPLGVAGAAAARTEPETLMKFLHEAFAHQRSLWDWLICERYQVSDDGPGVWLVIDTEKVHGPGRTVAELSGAADEDAAHALAEHLNHKITLARVAQATADLSGIGNE
jgi:hypothetical protein